MIRHERKRRTEKHTTHLPTRIFHKCSDCEVHEICGLITSLHIFPNALLQWEDFLKSNAINQLKRFRDKLCTFNDDIQGTAGVVVTGIYSGLKITGQNMRDQRILFAGAGASAQGISDLIVSALIEDGLSKEEARKHIWTVDSKGLVTKARTNLEDTVNRAMWIPQYLPVRHEPVPYR